MLPGFTASQENGHTVLAGEVGADLSVFDLVERVRLAGLDLISVTPAEPNLEEIFIELVERAEQTPAQDTALQQKVSYSRASSEVGG